MKRKDVIHCSFQNWYKSFADITIKSVIIPVSSDALHYLQDNGTLVLPHQVDTDFNAENECNQEQLNVNLDEFSEKITEAISTLGGKVFPKLNWSSPKDASWISFNRSLKCYNPCDVYLLLKSSDCIAENLTTPFKGCDDNFGDDELVDYFLALRQWEEINPSNEFRVFVRDRKLIGICQREISQYYPYIDKEKDRILADIHHFWKIHICDEFPSPNYVMDVYRPGDSEVLLVDFSPFGGTIDSLLFTWHELLQTKVLGPADINDYSTKWCNRIDEPEFRYIAEPLGVQPSPYMKYGLPWDMVGLSKEEVSKISEFVENKVHDEMCLSSNDLEEDSSLR